MFALSRSVRFVFVLLSLSLCTVSCSKLVDFDRDKIVAEDASTGTDGNVQTGGGDAEADARVDAAPVDAAMDADADVDADLTACDVDTHAGCGADELCCMTVDGPACQPTDPTVQCTGCEVACDMASTSACTDRTCTCEGNVACEGSTPLCDAAMATCVECLGVSDCTAAAGNYCVGGTCSACDPGALADDISDDEGCSGITPVCGDGNVCVGCTVTPDNCPDPLYCVQDEGCFGCDPAAEVGSNGCPAVTPVCEAAASGDYACIPCRNNLDCLRGDYCDNVDNGGAGGSCQDACDPDNNNGCTDPALPFCVVSQGVASCVPCSEPSAPDCPSGQLCKQSGARAGECVGCVGDGDCTQPGLGICDDTSFTCGPCSAANNNADCNGDVCDTSSGECEECVVDSDCGNDQQICTNNACQNVQCTRDNQCADQQVCNSNNLCVNVGCTRDVHCDSAAPHCNLGTNTCEGCNVTGAGGDTLCDARVAGEVCATTGPNAGACGACDPADNNGCMLGSANPYCSPTTLSCRPCTSAPNGGDSFCGSLSAGQLCVSSGAHQGECGGCDPTDHQGCVRGSTTPYCNPNSVVCGACTTASGGADAFCNTLNQGDVCATTGVNAGACGECDPSDHAECALASNAPYCNAATLSCAACGTAPPSGDAFCESRRANTQCDASGSCDCDLGFGGATCSTCATGFTGANCDQCAAGYYGANCTACACVGTEICDEGIAGTGACCGDGSQGPGEACDDGDNVDCGTCNADCSGAPSAPGCTGDACTADGECASGTCDLSGGSPGTCN